MKRPLIMVDVDDTLTYSDRIFTELAQEMGIPWVQDSDRWLTAEDLGTSRELLTNLFRRAHSREIMMAQDPIEGSVEALNQLHDEGSLIFYVSARSLQAETTLKIWLEHHGFPNPLSAVAQKDKVEWMRIHQPAYVIDDRVKTILHCFRLRIPVFALERSWNVNLTNESPDIHICKDWSSIYNSMVGKELVTA